MAVVLSRMEAVFPERFATAKSGFPSLLKSPILTDLGLLPVAKGTWVAKVGVGAYGGGVEQDGGGVAGEVRDS